MNNSQVAHAWANQTKKSGAAGHYFFDGPCLFSYGRHFMAGRIVTPGAAPGLSAAAHGVALITSRRYSVTTVRHVSLARGAASHLKTFTVPALDLGASAIGENYRYYDTEIDKARGALVRGRVRLESREEYLRNVVKEAAKYVAAFPIKSADLALMAAADREDVKNARANILKAAADMAAGVLVTAEERTYINAQMVKEREAREAEAARAAARAAAELAEMREKLALWAAGADIPAPCRYAWGDALSALPTILRIKGAAVETSRGAVVSCRAARVVWHMIKAGRDIVGHVVDGFTISAFNGVLKIGCHTIERAEVERVGALLDQRDAARDAAAGENVENGGAANGGHHV